MRYRKTDHLLKIIIFFITVITVSTRIESDPCLDGVKVDTYVLSMPEKYANLTPPWIRTDGTPAKVTQSAGVVYQWSWMKSLSVTGISKQVDDVLGFLDDNNCFFVPVGPSVRASVLNTKAVYLSGEVSCELHELYGKCVAKFGPTGCSLYPNENGGWGSYRLEIGDASSNRSTYNIKAEPIVLHEWRSLLGATPDKWRFTVDTLAIFDDGVGHVYVIDPTGQGYLNLCEQKIVPATEDWAEWSKNQPLKIMGFYELRSSGFSSKNESLQMFINEEIKVSDKRITQKFYCENVLKGVANLEGSTPICHTKFPDRDDIAWISTMRHTMKTEMGSNWNSTIGSVADELEAVFCTDRQFDDVRSRLLHRIASSDDGTYVIQEPRIIEEGRPMIEDSAHVHSRPILDMSAKLPVLPPEYPNSPRAQPNENLEFVEPQVEGAGMDPIAIQVHKIEDPELITAEQEVDLRATRAEIGTPADPPTENAYNSHNPINVQLPVMRFDKVEENGLGDVAASAIDGSSVTSSASSNQLYCSIIISLVFLSYFLV